MDGGGGGRLCRLIFRFTCITIYNSHLPISSITLTTQVEKTGKEEERSYRVIDNLIHDEIITVEERENVISFRVLGEEEGD